MSSVVSRKSLQCPVEKTIRERETRETRHLGVVVACILFVSAATFRKSVSYLHGRDPSLSSNAPTALRSARPRSTYTPESLRYPCVDLTISSTNLENKIHNESNDERNIQTVKAHRTEPWRNRTATCRATGELGTARPKLTSIVAFPDNFVLPGKE